MSDLDTLVVGAGIAGLAAAAELEARGVEVCVVDAGDRPGGVMRTDRVQGYLVERGPNTLQVKAPLRELLDDRGLTSRLIEAAPVGRSRYLVHEGRLEPVPMGLGPLVASPLLSTRAKLRLLAEPFVPRGDAAGESVDAFVSRRLGPEVSRNLVGAFLTGVYAGDERALGAAAVFPSLVEYERARGSLVRGALSAALAARRAGGTRPLRGTWSCEAGLGALSDALAASLRSAPRLSTRVESLEPAQGGWRVVCRGADGARWDAQARRIVLATPAPAASRLLAPIDAEASRLLAGIEYAPIASLALGVASEDLARPVSGFGFLVPRHEEGQLLGCLFMSQLFPGRAPEGRELLHCMLGGTRSPGSLDLPDDALAGRACADLERLLGLRGKPDPVAVRRWPAAVPQPAPAHRGRVAALRERARSHPGLALAGAYLDGVAVADAAASGTAAARSLTSS